MLHRGVSGLQTCAAVRLMAWRGCSRMGTLRLSPSTSQPQMPAMSHRGLTKHLPNEEGIRLLQTQVSLFATLLFVCRKKPGRIETHMQQC